MFGTIIVWISFAAALASACLYFAATKKKKYLFPARLSFYAIITGIITVSVLLWVYILQHRFEYNYINRYSSRDLPLHLLITSFWAGQEGSFILWALIACIIGFILQRYAKQEKMECEAMTTYSLVLAFLSLLIIIKSPFTYVWDVAANKMPVGSIPPDGRGLNPLLQNFWMIIHPPVLFIGFASLAVPFVLAVAGLWQKKYKEWIEPALPWVLFGAVSLGAGLILGGYWAYGVLGWGGWWGWDPVENSSLIPWMIVIILIHTILIQKLKGKLVRTNFILAMLSYLMVIYCTFLTRSGILANTSVHSFAHPGSLAYIVLLTWLITFTLGGSGMIILRWKGLKTKLSKSNLLTRESFLTIACIVMGISAAVILFGTNKPLFWGSAFEPSFYDSANLPLAALLTLLLGFSLHAKWKQENRRVFLKKLILPGVLSVITLMILIFLGLTDILAILLVLTSLFALIVSISYGYQIAKENLLLIGGALSHAGLALLLLGIIASGRYDEKQSVSLPIYQPESVFGFDLTYTGSQPISDKKDKYIIEAEYNGTNTILEPERIKIPRSDDAMWSPDYFSTWKGDLYIEPVSVADIPNDEKQVTETLIADVSIKPFMNLVWVAAGLIIAGLTVTIIRRSQ